MCSYLRAEGDRYLDLGERYFEEFNTSFWLRAGNNLKVVSIINMSNLYYGSLVSKFIYFLFLRFIDSTNT